MQKTAGDLIGRCVEQCYKAYQAQHGNVMVFDCCEPETPCTSCAIFKNHRELYFLEDPMEETDVWMFLLEQGAIGPSSSEISAHHR